MENVEYVYNSYVKAYELKNALLDGERAKSESEKIMSQCFYALAIDSEYDIDFDLAEVIKILILRGFDTETLNNLRKKDEYTKLLNEDSINLKVANLCVRESQNIEKIKYESSEFNNIIKSYDKLRTNIRRGHVLWDVQKERLESTSEHTFGTLVLAILMDSQYDINYDLNKVLKMLLIHETEEVYPGDFTIFDDKKSEEELNNSVEKVLGNSKKKKEYLNLLDEFNSKETYESKISYLIDKMEYDLQVKMYETDGLYVFENRPSNSCTNSEAVQEIIANGADSVFEVHYMFDKSKFEHNGSFSLLLNYAHNKK